MSSSSSSRPFRVLAPSGVGSKSQPTDAGALVVNGERVPDPPGFSSSVASTSSSSRSPGTATATNVNAANAPRRPTTAEKQAALQARATGAAKSVAFLCFMMWMSGSQIHLFSIMTTASGIYQPLAAIANSGKVFPKEEKEDDPRIDPLTPRLLYCAVQVLGLAFALHKLNGMGLLPTTPSDYAGLLGPPRAREWVGSGVTLG